MTIDVASLPKTEQINLFIQLKKVMERENPSGLSEYFSAIRETRFSAGYACVHCGSVSVKRNGTYRGRQRYLCKDCGKSFNDLTHTPLAGTHYPEKWLPYIDYMVQGWTLPQIVKELEIHLSTAFYWRHKVLHALSSLGFHSLSGIVESDVTHFPESYKGEKVIHRKPKKRARKASKRGISNEQVSVLTAQDRKGHTLSRVAGRGKLTSDDMKTVLTDVIDPSAIFCSDEDTSFKKFAANRKLRHEIIPSTDKKRVRKGLYHIQHANNLHKRIKEWLRRFQGVATRYLDHYFYWFTWLDSVKHLSLHKQKEQMLLCLCQKANRLTVQAFREAS